MCTKMDITSFSMIILLYSLPLSFSCLGNNILESDVYDVYPGLKINSGLLLVRLESRVAHQDDARILCLMKCSQDPDCSMVTLEKVTDFICLFWKFNETNDISPSFNTNTTLYTKKNCEYIILFSSNFCSYLKFPTPYSQRAHLNLSR